MPRKRSKDNQGLPARWRRYHGAFFYRVPPGMEAQWDGKKQYRLGKTLGEAATEWAKRMATAERPVIYIRELLDRYALEVVPTKAIATQAGDTASLAGLRKVFGDMRLVDIEPQHVYKYADTRIDPRTGKKSPSTGRHDVGVLRHAYTKAVEWGLIKTHPFKGEVRLKGGKPRKRYVEDWEIAEALALKPMRKEGSVRMIQAYIRIKILIGLRIGDMLRIRMSDIDDKAGITVTPRKTVNTTGITRTFSWTPALREAVDMAIAARPVDIAPWLFCNKRGKGYFNEKTGKPHGWNSMWKRFMKRLKAETKIEAHFTDHDLRRKVGNDAESLARAQQMLGHADPKITQSVYRGGKPEIVQPLR
jgi:integrase